MARLSLEVRPHVPHPSLSLLLGLVIVACDTSGNTTGAAGSGSGSTGSGAAGAGATESAAAGASTGAYGTGSVGTTGAGGSNAGSGSGSVDSGAAGSATGGAGAANDASTDAPATIDGSSDRGEAGGPLTTAGCTNHNYPLCIDFENGIDAAVWTGGTPGAIVSDDVAHGAHSYRLYPMSGGTLKTTKMGTIKNQVWGRFYVHFKPGAPGGHGAIVGVFDQSNNWYEIGWQFDGMMGVWHAASNAERPLRSMPLIVDRWYCIEYFFDGASAAFPQWWIDGKEAQYYMAANSTLAPKTVTQFTNLFIGFTPYAGLGLQTPDGKGPIDTRVLTNMWIDDIAFDRQRIGCIQ